ncbi:hypothetical protein [Gilliamella apis]|uniref:hypothetical protein n=1 Tax=Gilliamella apis TaxID=1970738 RepID=UPI000A353FB9|nr:hypothetical protein [Gilliamella apis]OTQ79108.1 hypothetical protein B6D14_05855 [Gilliamella apis]
MVVLQSISFANYALTTKTTNIIYGSAPYLTFDGGRTRVTNTEALLGITLSDGRTFTLTTNNSSSTNPIELPVAGQSFADIGMLVPTDTDSIALSSLIGTPYNYWGDDDGDGQGVNGVTATGRLYLSIVDRGGQAVARNEVFDICFDRGPYKLTLSNTSGTLKTRYGVPNETRFTAGNATYYINPKTAPVICYARPNLELTRGISADVWKTGKGFLPQSSYGSNFPTTGANNLYFDLVIGGSNAQALSWAPVSHGGITATMTDSTNTSVKVTLTGPAVTDPNQWESENPDRIDRPSLPQVFELVGRDSSGNAVVKYGFELKQWFVNRGSTYDVLDHSSMESWCNKIGGYRVPNVRDLTNASCRQSNTGVCENYANEINALTATPSSPVNLYMRHIGAGFFTEWGVMDYYTGANFGYHYYWTSDKTNMTGDAYSPFYLISWDWGGINPRRANTYIHGVCVYP